MTKRQLLQACGFLMVWLFFCWRAAGEEGSPVVLAVFDVEDRGVGLSAETCSNLTDYLIAILTGPDYQVVPRQQVKERLLEAKKESYKTCYDQACQIELGRELAAHKILSTQLIKVGKKCRLVSVLLDLKKATTEKSFAVPSDCSEDNLLEALEKLVQGLTGQATAEAPASAGPTTRTAPAATAAPAPAESTTPTGQSSAAAPSRFRGRAFLGVELRPLDARQDQLPGLAPDQKGLMVVRVVENSPAQRAGIKPGDVILSFNGTATDSPAFFSRMVQRLGPSSRLELEIWREGSRDRLQIDLQEAPAATTTAPAPPAAPGPTRLVESTKVTDTSGKPKEIPIYHGHLTFHIGPVFENLYSGSSLSDVNLGGETYSAEISTGTGFFTEVTFDGHIDKIFSFGFGLLYFFNNNLEESGDRLSYLAPNMLFRLSLVITDWLETRTVFQLGSGVHLGTKLTLWKDQNTSKTVTRYNDWEQLFIKASQELVFYFTRELGAIFSFGLLCSSGYLDLEDKEYSFGLPLILFLSTGMEWR